MNDANASTRSIYISDDLWERLGPLAERITGGSRSQLIENIITAQISKIETCLEQAEEAGVLLCRTCMTS